MGLGGSVAFWLRALLRTSSSVAILAQLGEQATQRDALRARHDRRGGGGPAHRRSPSGDRAGGCRRWSVAGAEAVEAAAEALAAVARPARPLVYEKGGKDEKEFGPVILASGCFGAGFMPTAHGVHCTGNGIKVGEAVVHCAAPAPLSHLTYERGSPYPYSRAGWPLRVVAGRA